VIEVFRVCQDSLTVPVAFSTSALWTVAAKSMFLVPDAPPYVSVAFASHANGELYAVAVAE